MIGVFKHGSGKHINNFALGQYGRHRSNVWEYAGATALTKERREDLAMHPTVKPVALVADAIKDCSRRGGVIVDAFGGSGSTVIAAEITNRRAYVIEIEPRYVDVMIRRWQRLTGEPALREADGAEFSHLEKLTTGEA